MVKRAENGVRTRDLRLGKPTLYQLSYFREKCLPLQDLGLQIYEFKFIYRQKNKGQRAELDQ